MSARFSAALVHLFTATGAVLALLALRAAHTGDWQAMFAWLGVALCVDALDGPLARQLNVEAVLPRFSGERLDLIIDYLNYVAIPAFVLADTDLLPEGLRFFAAAAVLLSSLFHFVDLNSKTKEGYFIGFPAIWNIVLLYLFAFQPPPFVGLAFVMFLVVLTFVPILSVHPYRVRRLRPLTVIATFIWAAAAAAAVLNPFPSPVLVQALLIITGAYFVAVGLMRSLAPKSTNA